jgi:hypothetical protein
MNKREVADMLTAIITATPNTQELHPLLCALAKVADELYDRHNYESSYHDE